MAVVKGTSFTPALLFRSNSFARFCTHPVTSVSAGPPCGGLYLKPPSSGGLCDGVITMPSARCSLRPRLYTRIACEMTGVGVTPPVTLDECLHFVSRKDFQRRALGRTGQPMSVLAHIERAVDPLTAPVVANSLRNGQDMSLGERAAQRRAAVSAGSETDQLVGISNVGSPRVILSFEQGKIHQHIPGGRLTCER